MRNIDVLGLSVTGFEIDNFAKKDSKIDCKVL